MSDNRPPAGAPQGEPRPFDDFPAHAATGIQQEPEYLTDEPAKKKGGAGKGVAIAAAAAVLVGAGGMYAWAQFNGGGEHPYEKLADGAMFYVQTNTNPTAEQKLAINDLAKKFPEAKDEEGYEVLTADNINGALFAEAIESDKKYEYMGDRMAIAAYPDADEDGEPELAFIAQVTDDEAADEALKDLLAKAKDSDEPMTGEVADGYLMATTGDLDKVFTADSSLADNGDFADAMDDVKGNAVSGWADLKVTSDAIKASEASANEAMGDDFAMETVPTEYDVEGLVSFGLHAREDGLDFEVYSDGVKTNGKALEINGDQGATADLLNSIAYDDALLNLGVTGLGDFVKNAADSAGTDVSEEGMPITNEDLPGLLGDSAALSVRFAEDEFSGKLVLNGIDQSVLEEALASEGLTIEQAEGALQQQFGEDVTVELSEGELMAIMGDEPEGNGDFDSGTVMGSVDLDQMAAIFAAFSMDDDYAKELGVVSFSAELDDEGDGKAVLGWTTPR